MLNNDRNLRVGNCPSCRTISLVSALREVLSEMSCRTRNFCWMPDHLTQSGLHQGKSLHIHYGFSLRMRCSFCMQNSITESPWRPDMAIFQWSRQFWCTLISSETWFHFSTIYSSAVSIIVASILPFHRSILSKEEKGQQVPIKIVDIRLLYR